MPLYVSGEASSDSRALVETFLREDKELSRLADALREGELPTLTDSTVAPGAGRAALAHTKALLRRRTWLLALGIFFTGLPLSFVFGDSGLQFLLLRDAPILGSLSWAAAVALWVGFAVTARRMRVSGL